MAPRLKPPGARGLLPFIHFPFFRSCCKSAAQAPLSQMQAGGDTSMGSRGALSPNAATTSDATSLSFSIPLASVQRSAPRPTSPPTSHRQVAMALPVPEPKKRLLTPPPSKDARAVDLDSQSPRTDASWPSDEEMGDLLELKAPSVLEERPRVTPTGSGKKVSAKTTTVAVPRRANAPFCTDGMSADAIKQRKAQRRREQVRAASRRCRDRQRRETEDLRTKVFQLEEYISRLRQSHEWELRQHRQRAEELQHENELLKRQLSLTEANNVHNSVHNVHDVHDVQDVDTSSLEPVPLQTIAKPEDQELPADLVHCIVDEPPSPKWSHELVLHAAEDTTQQLVGMLESDVEPLKSPVIFGWQFDFWTDGDKYYGRNRKFFPGVSALELGQRMHHVDASRYMETFPEVEKMQVLQVLDENMLVIRIVKALPGKHLAQSVNAQFLAPTTPPHGSASRWVFAHRTIDESLDGEYELENECNGYVFEDAAMVGEDGSSVQGCIVQGVGGFESGGMEPTVLLEELSKAFSSVVLRWESLFINDYIPADADTPDFPDMVLDL